MCGLITVINKVIRRNFRNEKRIIESKKNITTWKRKITKWNIRSKCKKIYSGKRFAPLPGRWFHSNSKFKRLSRL